MAKRGHFVERIWEREVDQLVLAWGFDGSCSSGKPKPGEKEKKQSLL